MPLEQLIAAHLDRLFPAMKIAGQHAFRVTRDADVDVEVDEADDLLETLESCSAYDSGHLKPFAWKREGPFPRICGRCSLRELHLKSSDIYVIDGLPRPRLAVVAHRAEPVGAEVDDVARDAVAPRLRAR